MLNVSKLQNAMAQLEAALTEDGITRDSILEARAALQHALDENTKLGIVIFNAKSALESLKESPEFREVTEETTALVQHLGLV